MSITNYFYSCDQSKVVVVIYDRYTMHNRNASSMRCMLSFCKNRMTKLQSDYLVVINGASGT
jgi:hypothetical protein